MNDRPRQDRSSSGGDRSRRSEGRDAGGGGDRRDDGRRSDGPRRSGPTGGGARRGGDSRRESGRPHGGDRGRRDDRHSGERGGPGRSARDARPARPERPREPELDEDAHIRELSKEARGRLRGLSKENAERVGAHLVMAGRLLDSEPELSYEHAQAAVRRAGRIDIVREAAGLAAYRTGRFAEALRELRTVRRLNGSSEHLPLMADAERGLGRPERAVALAQSDEARTLDAETTAELMIVVSGARSDLGEHDAALTVLDRIPAAQRTGDQGLRVLQARAVALEAAGRGQEATALLAGVDAQALARATGMEEDGEDVVVFDTFDDDVAEDPDQDVRPAAGPQGRRAPGSGTDGSA